MKITFNLHTKHKMRFFEKHPDGGKDSPVMGYWLLEIKWLFSIVLLKFNPGFRENYHTHAFTALTWFLRGYVNEHRLDEKKVLHYKQWSPSIWPKITLKNNMHKVSTAGEQPAWALPIRGPWDNTWTEYNAKENKIVVLGGGGRRLWKGLLHKLN